MFFLKHSDFNNVYYDTDFSQIRKLVKDLTDLLKIMDSRHNRRNTIQIAKSVFDYISKRDLTLQYPQEMFDFRFNDVRICIARRKDEHKKDFYCVCCLGWKVPGHYRQYMNEYGYFHCNALEEVYTHFLDLVHDFTLENQSALF